MAFLAIVNKPIKMVENVLMNRPLLRKLNFVIDLNSNIVDSFIEAFF